MPRATWKIALPMGLCLGTLAVAFAQNASIDEPPQARPRAVVDAPKPESARKEKTDSVVNTIKLVLRISGLGPKGCDVEIKPGHSGCKFKTIERHVARDGRAVTVSVRAESLGADHDCAFAITLREPNQKPMTYRRGVRLVPPTVDKPDPIQSVPCFLISPSLAARNQDQDASSKSRRR